MKKRLLPILIILFVFALLLLLVFFWFQQASTSMKESVIAGIIANLITTVVFTMVGICTFISIFVWERQQLFRFFGVNSNVQGIHIYLSRLEVLPGGTKGAEPIKVGYVGPTLIRIEYLAALLVHNLFKSKILSLVPKNLTDLLSKIHITLSDVDIMIDVSPSVVTDSILSENLILVGSSIYNYITQHYLKEESNPYSFGKNVRGERIIKVGRDFGGLELEGRAFNHELAVIHRINDFKHGTSVFICAGLGSSASFGSVRYLVQNWRKLQRHYGQSEFAFCLMFENQQPDNESVVEPRRIHEIPLSS